MEVGPALVFRHLLGYKGVRLSRGLTTEGAGEGFHPIMTDPRQESVGGGPDDLAASVSSSLLAGLFAQDPEAWGRLVRLYYPLVRNWCLRARLQADDAADVAQEVFRALAGNVGRFERKEQVIGAGGTDAQRRF